MISLSFFNLVFVSGIFFGLLGTLVGLWVTGAALALSGLAVFLAALFSPALPMLLPELEPLAVVGAAFIGVGLMALGLLACLGLYYVTIGAYKLVVKYLQLNLKIIKGTKKSGGRKSKPILARLLCSWRESPWFAWSSGGC